MINVYPSKICLLNLQEEKEKRLEEMFESDLDNAFENRYATKEEVPEEGAVALAGKKTQETLTATDLIIDALDLAEVELKRIAEHEVIVFSHYCSTLVSIVCPYMPINYHWLDGKWKFCSGDYF